MSQNGAVLSHSTPGAVTFECQRCEPGTYTLFRGATECSKCPEALDVRNEEHHQCIGELIHIFEQRENEWRRQLVEAKERAEATECHLKARLDLTEALRKIAERKLGEEKKKCDERVEEAKKKCEVRIGEGDDCERSNGWY